jgi:hypothetical protein
LFVLFSFACYYCALLRVSCADLDRPLISSAVSKLLQSQNPAALMAGSWLYATYYYKIDLTEEARAGLAAVQR